MQPISTTSRFLDSVARVNGHLNYEDTSYNNVDLVVELAKALRLRGWRDGAHGIGNDDTCSDLYQRQEKLVDLGIKFCVVIDPSENLPPLTGEVLNDIYWKMGQRVELWEGMNEPNNGSPQGWPSKASLWQGQLWSANSTMASFFYGRIKVVAPSLSYLSSSQFQADAKDLGNLTPHLDLGNLHAYPGPNPPTAAIPVQEGIISTVSGTKPVVVTECGYSTLPGVGPGVSELAQAKYTPRMLAWYFMNQVQQVYLYELLDLKQDTDQNLEYHWGMVRYDGTVKPAFKALATLFGRCDTPDCTLIPLDVTLTQAVNVKSMLLQKSLNTWSLFIWQEVSVWNGTDQSNDPVPVTLSFNGVPHRVTTYLPLSQDTPLDTQVVTMATLSVPDHLMVVEIEG
jgi:hypothetical protein